MYALLDLVLILVFAIFAAALFKLPTLISRGLAWFILAWANLILSLEAADLVGVLSEKAFYLLVHGIIAGVAVGIWWGKQRPALVPAWGNWNIRQSVRDYPAVWVLGAGVVVGYMLGLVAIFYAPPNNWDSMSYHLSRVGYWYQHGSLEHWATPNPRQTTFPMNAELGILWTVIGTGSDRWVEIVQWTSVPAAMLAIVGIARLLGFGRVQSLFAACLWASLPEIILQAATTQNDLVVSTFFVSMVYLLFLGIKTSNYAVLSLSAIACGLAIGTKYTVLLIFPGLAMVVLLLWWSNGISKSKLFIFWSAAAVIAAILFASLNIIRNLQNYDHPLGPKDFVDTVTMSPSSRVRMTAENMAHYSYQMVDFSGLPPHVASLLHQIKAGIAGIAPEGKSLTFDVDEVGPSLHEDTAWFGPLGAFLLVPVILLYTFRRWRKAEPYTISLLVLFWSFLIVLSASETWTPFKGRYIVLVITLTAPFFAALLKPNDYAKKAVWGIVALALLIILWTTTHNELKPFVGSEPIWGEDRASNQTRGNRSVEPVIRMVEQRVNDGATLGILLGGDDWNYPLFGERFERELVQIYPYSRIQDCEWLQAQQIDLVLINPTYFRETLPAHLAEIDRANGYILAKSVCSA